MQWRRARGSLLLAATLLLWTPFGALSQLNPRDLLPPFLTFPLQNVPAGAQANDDLFTIIFIADSEPRMRANTDGEVRRYIDNLVSYKTSRLEYFAHAGGRTHRVDPQLVILAGDISADRETSVAADAHLWQPLADNGIAFLAGFGNHDWTQTSYDFSGDSWNAKATQFCRETYRNTTRLAAPHFGYREFGPSDSRGPVTAVASFRGVQIVNFNSFLYQPSYHYDFESPIGQRCIDARATQGWAGCQVFASAEPQIQQLEAALDADAGVTTLFVQHFPMTTQDVWWEDFSASGASTAQKKQRLKDMIARYRSSALFTGHNHRYARVEHSSEGFSEYIAPYFGGNGGSDLNQGGGFLALLVSRTQGIVEVKHIPTPLYDPLRTTSTSRSPGATTSTALRPTDTSILGTVTSKAQAQACMLSNCIVEALTCSGDRECSALGSPLLLNTGSAGNEELAQLLWGLAFAAPNNAAVHSVAACADRSCGSAILSISRPASPSAGPSFRGTTGAPPSNTPSTTWNPWVALSVSGSRRQRSMAPNTAMAAFVAMVSAVLPRLH